MKKIYESDFNCWDESADKVHVYALDGDDEYYELESMNFEERCECCHVWEESNVPPGMQYHRYSFHLHKNHLIMVETVAINI